MDHRRRLILGISGTPLVPRFTLAQQPGRVHHVGILSIGGDPATQSSRWKPFTDAMRELGVSETHRSRDAGRYRSEKKFETAVYQSAT